MTSIATGEGASRCTGGSATGMRDGDGSVFFIAMKWLFSEHICTTFDFMLFILILPFKALSSATSAITRNSYSREKVLISFLNSRFTLKGEVCESLDFSELEYCSVWHPTSRVFMSCCKGSGVFPLKGESIWDTSVREKSPLPSLLLSKGYCFPPPPLTLCRLGY